MAGLPNVTLTHSSVAVAITSTAVIAANADRIYLLIQNISDTAIDLFVGGAAVASQGIRLQANGGSIELSARNGNLDTRAINAIHAGTGTKTLLVSAA